MNFKQLNGKTIDEAFKEFHQNNKHIYTLFVDHVQKAWQNGNRKLSAKHILYTIRFMRIQTFAKDDYKINDAYTSRYARKFMNDFQEYGEIFELRQLKS